MEILFALEELGIPYKKRIVDITSYENADPWFLKINPKGKVPTLQVGDRFMSESMDIVKYLDENYNTGEIKLLPDESTDLGAAVKKWTQIFSDRVEIETLTYGCVYFPEISDGINGPKFYLNKAKNRMTNIPNLIDERIKKNPENREILEAMRKGHLFRYKRMVSKDVVCDVIEEVGKVMEDAEVQLASVKSAHPNTLDTFFCGPAFTMADINLCILLGRLYIAGLLERNLKGRPLLAEYHTRLQKRPFVQNTLNRLPLSLLLRGLLPMKTMAVLFGAIAVGVGVYLYTRKSSS